MKSSDLFSLVRLIVPQIDKQRGIYNMKEAMLAKVYSETFGLPKSDADKLKHFKDPAQLVDVQAVRDGIIRFVLVFQIHDSLAVCRGSVTSCTSFL